jgi:hypothetical protein
MAKQFNFEGTLFEQPTDFKNKGMLQILGTKSFDTNYVKRQ